jgi:hypothetical protein
VDSVDSSGAPLDVPEQTNCALSPWRAKKLKKAPFDVKAFLATVDGGRTLSSYRNEEAIFSQGDPADAVF